MRNFLTLLALALACVHPSTAQTETDRERAGLTGPVRAVRVERAQVSNVSGQLVEGARTLAQSSSFDEKGNATGQSLFKPDGSLDRKLGWGYTYDAKGRETERTFLNAEGVITSRAVSAYDGRGRKVEMTFYNPDGAVNHVQTFVYDDRGKLIREAHLNPDGTVRNVSVYTYDAGGRLREWSMQKPDGSLSQRKVSNYDEKGREIEWTVYRGDGTPALGQRSSYDERGNVVESLRYGNGVLVSRETFTYEFDAHGNWVERRLVRETVKEGYSLTEVEVSYRTITYY
jgi:YD repeat-containing protein